MLILTNLKPREKVYLAALANKICQIEIFPETLGALKLGVLEAALNTIRPALKNRQIKVIQNIINKIPQPGILDAEYVVPAGNLLTN